MNIKSTELATASLQCLSMVNGGLTHGQGQGQCPGQGQGQGHGHGQGAASDFNPPASNKWLCLYGRTQQILVRSGLTSLPYSIL